MLKVKPARYAVNIHNFPCKIQMWHQPALHGIGIYLLQVYAAASNKFFFKNCFATYYKLLRGKGLY